MRVMQGVVILIVVFLVLVGAIPSAAGGTVILKSGHQTLMEVKKPGVVLIRGEEYSYRVLKKGSRLRLISKSGKEGVYFKRYGTTILIRNLKGSLLHLIKKSGYFYRVKTVMGAILSSMKIEHRQVVVENSGTEVSLHVVSEKGNVVFRLHKGVPPMVLKGETRPFPAAFFGMTPLSLQERVACYLTYR